ncbi:hypothetical protein ACFE04_017370 [Oxalis oulophora]
MAMPTREEIEMFMSITGASESLALRRLEEFGGNLQAAVNAHYREFETQITHPVSSIPPANYPVDMNYPVQGGSRGLFSAVRSFRPSLLLDANYRRSLVNQIGASAFASNVNPHPGDFSSGNMQHYNPGPRPVFENVVGTSSSYAPGYNENLSNVPTNGSDVEDEMLQAAIEASKRDLEISSGGDMEDNEAIARALSLSLKTAEQEKLVRAQNMDDRHTGPGVYDFNQRAESINSGRSKPGSSLLREGARNVEELPTKPNQEVNGLSFEELNEAMMLEAAFFSQVSVNPSSHLHNESVSSNQNPVHCSPKPSIATDQLLRKQQDEEYLASLMADREKEIKSMVKEEEACKKVQQGEVSLADKEARLRDEPKVDNENAVSLLIRMPDGSRHSRRFLKSNKLQLLFDFLDVSKAVKPGEALPSACFRDFGELIKFERTGIDEQTRNPVPRTDLAVSTTLKGLLPWMKF